MKLKTRKISVAVILSLFILIVLLAAYLRLASLNLGEFKSDEAGTSFVLKALVQHGMVPLLGPPLSTAGNAGPFYYYILAIPFLISTNPLVSMIFVALVNVLGVIFIFKFAREFFNERIALIASALEAVSPFAVLFSRKIWNPDLIFPFTVLLFYCVYSFVIKKKPKYLVPIFVLYAIILQIHPITFFLAPVILLFIWQSRSQIQARYVLIGVAFGLVLFSPFIYGQVTTGFRETGFFASTLKNFAANVNPTVIQHISSNTSGSGFDYILGADAPTFYSSIFNLNNYFVVENICLYLGFALIVIRAARTRKPFSGENLKYSILLSWIAVPTVILIFFNSTAGLWTHHVVMFFPANFIVVAILFDSAIGRKDSRSTEMTTATNTAAEGAAATAPSSKLLPKLRFGKNAIVVLILLSILLVQTVFDLSFLNFINTQGGTSGDYGVALEYKADVAKYIAQNSNGTSFTISNNLTPGAIGLEYYYLLSLYGKAPSTFGSINYVVINNVLGEGVDPLLLQQVSKDPKVSFGPLTVYTVR